MCPGESIPPPSWGDLTRRGEISIPFSFWKGSFYGPKTRERDACWLATHWGEREGGRENKKFSFSVGKLSQDVKSSSMGEKEGEKEEREPDRIIRIAGTGLPNTCKISLLINRTVATLERRRIGS